MGPVLHIFAKAVDLLQDTFFSNCKRSTSSSSTQKGNLNFNLMNDYGVIMAIDRFVD